MPETSPGITQEKYHGQFYFGGPGFDVTTLRGDRGPRGTYDGVVLLKGGLGDPASNSMFGIAEHVVEMSDGDLVAAVVGTTRPRNPFTVARSLYEPRKHQSQSVFRASDHLNDRFHAPVLVQAGQSRGAVSVVDGGLYQTQNPKVNIIRPELGVVTIDGPGVYGPIEYEGHITRALVELGLHCLEDLDQLSVCERAKFFGKSVLSSSVYEPIFFTSDVMYLKDIDISDKIEVLRMLGVDVRHIFHDQDIVPGAEVPSPFATVLSGGHLRFMVEPEPIAKVLVDFARELRDGVPNVHEPIQRAA